MAALWHPDAQRISFGGIGDFAGGGRKIVWHTTEGSTIEDAVAAYRATRDYPHFTVQWAQGKLRIAQHAPINVAVTTLVHPPGTPETNRANCIQIEICGFAKDSPNWSAAMYAALGRLARWIEANAGVPRRCGVRFAVPASRLSGTAFYAYAGHIGHEHVPGNEHWDPGAMKIELVLGGAIPTGKRRGSEKRGSARTQVAVCQQLLRAHGFTAVPVDGRLGPRTKHALKHFQSSQGLRPVTGKPDPRTLAALAHTMPPSAAPAKPGPSAAGAPTAGLQQAWVRTSAISHGSTPPGWTRAWVPAEADGSPASGGPHAAPRAHTANVTSNRRGAA